MEGPSDICSVVSLRNNMEENNEQEEMRPEGRASDCIRSCGPGKDFSFFNLRETLECLEQRKAGSLWLLRRSCTKTISGGIPIIQVVWIMGIVVEMVKVVEFWLCFEYRAFFHENEDVS